MNYPTLRLGVLQGLATLKVACDAEQGYLRRPDCPYDNDTIELLEKLFKPVEVQVVVEKLIEKPSRGKVGRPSEKKGLSEDDANELEVETREMLTELRTMAKTEEGDLKQLDTGTRLSILKTRTQLLEKLVSIRERFTSARKVIEFRSTVIRILDDLIPEENREEFLKRLEGHLE